MDRRHVGLQLLLVRPKLSKNLIATTYKKFKLFDINYFNIFTQTTGVLSLPPPIPKTNPDSGDVFSVLIPPLNTKIRKKIISVN